MTQILLRETCPQLCKQNNDDTREGEQEGGKREERRGERERERERGMQLSNCNAQNEQQFKIHLEWHKTLIN